MRVVHGQMLATSSIIVSTYDVYCNVIRRIKMDVGVSYNEAKWLLNMGMIETLRIVGALE